MMNHQAQSNELSPRWTPEVLRRCTPREILVIVVAYGAEAVAARLGYADVQKFIAEKTLQQ